MSAELAVPSDRARLLIGVHRAQINHTERRFGVRVRHEPRVDGRPTQRFFFEGARAREARAACEAILGWQPVTRTGVAGKVYVDGGVLVPLLFPPRTAWNARAALERARALKEAWAGVEPLVFWDDFRDGEGWAKWRARREAELEFGSRDAPPLCVELCHEILLRAGIASRFCAAAPCDDTLAAWAARDGAAVLSPDKDFFRYPAALRVYALFDPPTRVWTEHRMHQLAEHMPALPPLSLPSPAPPLADDYGAEWQARFGAPSPLVRELGNPYLRLAPLRAELYGAPTSEEILDWQEGPYWHRILVRPSPATRLRDCLDPLALAEELCGPLPEDTFKQQQHAWACRALVLQLWTRARGSDLLQALLHADTP